MARQPVAARSPHFSAGAETKVLLSNPGRRRAGRSVFRMSTLVWLLQALLVLRFGVFQASCADGLARQIPGRTLSLPEMASPELRQLIASPPTLLQVISRIPEMESRLHVHVRPVVIGGVKCFELKPDVMPPANLHRVLLHLHGGAYVAFNDGSGIGEAVLMAGIGHFLVISVDYRIAPKFPYPAAIDDSIAVWRAILTKTKPADTAVFGTSAGGAMTLELVQRALAEHLPIPAAIGVGTPWADLSMTGDSLETNEFVDDQLVTASGSLNQAARLYAHGMNLRDPRLSPLYGKFDRFPPTILTTGTRDLFLSNTVLTHRKLRQAHVEAELNVYEGMSHAQYLIDDNSPETRSIFEDISDFFDRHLGT